MANLWCEESFVHILNKDQNNERGYRLGDSQPYETFTEDLGRLFKSCQKEHGRCTSTIYVDTSEPNKPKKIGWVFEKKNPDGPGLIQVWVTIWKDPPVKHVTWTPGTYAEVGE